MASIGKTAYSMFLEYFLKNPNFKDYFSVMKLWLNRLNWLDFIMTTSKHISKIAHTKIRQLASQARQLELGDIKDIENLNALSILKANSRFVLVLL